MKLTPEIETAILCELPNAPRGEWSYALRNILAMKGVANVPTAQVARWLNLLRREGTVEADGQTPSTRFNGWRITPSGTFRLAASACAHPRGPLFIVGCDEDDRLCEAVAKILAVYAPEIVDSRVFGFWTPPSTTINFEKLGIDRPHHALRGSPCRIARQRSILVFGATAAGKSRLAAHAGSRLLKDGFDGFELYTASARPEAGGIRSVFQVDPAL